MSMDVSYASPKVMQYFDDFDKMKKRIGTNETKIVKRRHNELCAATSFSEYLALNLGKPHSLSHDLSDCFGVSITGNIRLVIKPLCEDRTPEALKNCIKSEVIGVVKYHEGKKEWLIP